MYFLEASMSTDNGFLPESSRMGRRLFAKYYVVHISFDEAVHRNIIGYHPRESYENACIPANNSFIKKNLFHVRAAILSNAVSGFIL